MTAPVSRRILTVDIGNTAVKCSLFEGEDLVSVCAFRVAENAVSLHEPELRQLALFADGAICCSVGNCEELMVMLETLFGDMLLVMDHSTPLPLAIDYRTPLTLGLDRIAAAVGAVVSDPEGSMLIVDAGTAVTADLVSAGRFLGGNISPGLRLRFESLNRFTSKLPLVGVEGEIPQFGFNTETAIRAGVIGGLTAEIATLYEGAAQKYDDVKLIVAGGDASLLAERLAARGLNPIMDSSIVGRGLKAIYNNYFNE